MGRTVFGFLYKGIEHVGCGVEEMRGMKSEHRHKAVEMESLESGHTQRVAFFTG